MSDSATSSIIKSLTDIAVDAVDLSKPKTSQTTILYKSGSLLTPIMLQQLSY